MAEINQHNFAIFCVFSTTSLVAMTYHTYKYDKCRCMIPNKKDWYRCLLLWFLFLSNICLLIWAAVWLWVKVELGWVKFGPYGARPWPASLFPEKYMGVNAPLVVILAVSYSLQASLNAQEGLYWFHLIRSVRRPRSATAFLKSRYFVAWIVISVVTAAIQISVPWLGFRGDMLSQLSIELLTSGSLELVVLIASFTVIAAFPRFLAEVRASGAGPDVLARLYYFHELNKARAFFRFIFTASVFIFGIDGQTADRKVNLNPLASDILASGGVGALCVVFVISILLYLPRSTPSAVLTQVIIGQQRSIHATQLMSMLREGGQWEGLDEDSDLKVKDASKNDAPFASADMRGVSWTAGPEERWGRDGAAVPSLLGSFQSPIAVSNSAQPPKPLEVRMEVETDVHQD